MNDLKHLPPKVAAAILRNREIFGIPPKGWRYPTYEEAMSQDRELEAQREISVWFRKLEADGWKFDGIPISSLD
jgi:hypothetical protein